MVARVLAHEGRQNAALLCCTGDLLYEDRQCRVLTTNGCRVQWFHSVHACPAAGCAVSGAAVLARTVSCCHRGRTVELVQQPTENETAAGRLLAPLYDLRARNKTRPERWSGYATTQSLIHRLSSFRARICLFFHALVQTCFPPLYWTKGEPNKGAGSLSHPGSFETAAGAAEGPRVAQHCRSAGLGRAHLAGGE